MKLIFYVNISNEISAHSRHRNKFRRDPTKENELAFKNQKKECITLRQRNLKNHLVDRTGKGFRTNNKFWKFIKLFLLKKV